MKNIKSKNRKASYDYFLSDELEVGLVLISDEVKIVQKSGIDLKNSYVKIIDSEVFLLNSVISDFNYDEFFHKHKDKYPLITKSYEHASRPRKLLLQKKQIKKFEKLLNPGYTLVLTEIYSNENNKIKGTLALAKGKQLHDKRNAIKERDLSRISS